jgi:hypothetical protein
MMTSTTKISVLLGMLVLLVVGRVSGEPVPTVSGQASPIITRLHLYLAAGDYRRALELSQREIDEAPSAASYIHLTYVYHAIDGYLEHLSQEERWTAVEHLYLNLAYRDTEDLVDPPGGLARMAKEMIQTSVRQQSDVSAAMAARLDKAESDRLWSEQTRWRSANPKTWWQGIPMAWGR